MSQTNSIISLSAGLHSPLSNENTINVIEKKRFFHGHSIQQMDSTMYSKYYNSLQSSSGADVVIQEIFFEKKSNFETDLFIEMLLSTIKDSRAMQIKNDGDSFKIYYKNAAYDFYEFMAKIKWDLVKFDKKQLKAFNDKYNLASADSISYNGSKNQKKYYQNLYKELSKEEKNCIREYTSSSYYPNLLLRNIEKFMNGSIYASKDSIRQLISIAITCSGLNKIPESSEKYIYRVETSEGDKFYNIYKNSLDKNDVIKNRAFTSCSSEKVIFYSAAATKVYLNAKMAKDISGLSAFFSENEFLMLPNTKEQVLRIIKSEKKAYQSAMKPTCLGLVKLVSKRNGLF